MNDGFRVVASKVVKKVYEKAAVRADLKAVSWVDLKVGT